jgi:para-nitrobenzyl esterase
MRLIHLATGIAIAVTASVSFAESAPPQAKPEQATPAPAATARYSSTTTLISVLLADPAAKAILAKYIPQLVNSTNIDQVSGMTLKDVQQFAPDLLADKVLAEIDAELSKLTPQ